MSFDFGRSERLWGEFGPSLAWSRSHVRMHLCDTPQCGLWVPILISSRSSWGMLVRMTSWLAGSSIDRQTELEAMKAEGVS